jgi:lipooligosaccharide transport system permease protein
MAVPAFRVVEHNVTSFRHVWRTGITTMVVPLLFLGSIGLGLGSLIGGRTSSLGGVSYLVFLAPGLLAASAMQAGALEGSWPALAKIRWNRVYHAMLTTPLSIDDVLLGELIWTALRLSYLAIAFFLAMVLFGAIRSPWGLLAIPVAVLTGLAFYTPILALTGVVRADGAYSVLFRLGITPLFLLGGAFFPLDRLPGIVQAIAWITPIYHGVALSRSLTTGVAQPLTSAVDVLVLVAVMLSGLLAARITFSQRLLR